MPSYLLTIIKLIWAALVAWTYIIYSNPVLSQVSNKGSSKVSNCIEGLPCADKRATVAFPKTVISLGMDTSLEYESLTILDGTVIQTNGYALTIITRFLIVQGTVHIRSFDSEISVDRPPPAPSGPEGLSHNPGPSSSGNGLPGGAGNPGADGQPGRWGNDANLIRLMVLESGEGNIVIDNSGGPGGQGAKGGNGGAGGSGEQGERARSGIFDCSRGPDVGGQGGSGGNGGAGGEGGRGGNGGLVLIQVPAKTQLKVTASTKGGQGGDPGEPGLGGPGGLPGFGGRGDGLCQGKEADRRGPSGQPGARGQLGRKGQVGKAGSVLFL